MKKVMAWLMVCLLLLAGLSGCGQKPQPTSENTPAPLTVKVAALRGPTAVAMIPMIDGQP